MKNALEKKKKNSFLKDEERFREEEELFREGINQKDYKYWVLANGKIITGWEYQEDAKDYLNELKDESGISGRVYTRQGLKKFGINSDDDSHWGSEKEAREAK